MDDRRARQLVARERVRIEAVLLELTGDVQADVDLGRQQTGESDSGSASDDAWSPRIAETTQFVRRRVRTS